MAALLSKKANAPVMMRITRDDEHAIGRARPALHSRVKIGFRKDGRITALDGFAIVDNGPYDVVNDARSAGDHISLACQPLAMRWRMVTVLTNTPPRGAQRAPGGMQGNSLMEPILAKAARQLGIDQVAIRRINAPEGKADVWRPQRARTAEPCDERVPEGRPRQRGRALQLGRAEGAKRAARGIQGARRRRRSEHVFRRLDRVRRAHGHQAGRPACHPVGHRQPRHRVGVRLPSRGGRHPRRAVGKGRYHLGQHGEEPAEHLQPGRQPDGARHDARGPRRRIRRQEEAAGDRRQDARRQSRRRIRSRTSGCRAADAA